MNKIIGIAGVSKAGKDTFFQGLKDAFPGLNFMRLSLADRIRQDLREFVWANFTKDIYSLSSEDKEKFRPLMAWYGNIKRQETKGLYFLKSLEIQLGKLYWMDNTIFVITDIRFAEFDFDEPEWIHKHNGLLIHLTRYEVENLEKVPPSNDLEKINDPLLEKKADYHIHWKTILTKNDGTENIRDTAKQFMRSMSGLEPLIQNLRGFTTFPPHP